MSGLSFAEDFSLVKVLQSGDSDSSIDMADLTHLLGTRGLYALKPRGRNALNTMSSSPTPVKTSSPLVYSSQKHKAPLPKTPLRSSTVYTNLSPDSSQVSFASSVHNAGKTPQRCTVHQAVQTSTSFCTECGRDTRARVQCRAKRLSFWNKLGFLLDSVRCCGEPGNLAQYQELVWSCEACGRVLSNV